MQDDKRPYWTDYFMMLANDISTRSLDSDSKFGCIAVGQNNQILSTGYNGPPRQINDNDVPLTRPEKYIWMEHAERNCIYNAAMHGISLKDCTFYVTGVPCIDCLRAMYQVGASRIVFDSCRKAHSQNADWEKFIEKMSIYIIIESYEYGAENNNIPF
ncbi:MAG: deoxycytidylate deaminase [Candidatus Heimdallarchaeota archaeon]